MGFTLDEWRGELLPPLCSPESDALNVDHHERCFCIFFCIFVYAFLTGLKWVGLIWKTGGVTHTYTVYFLLMLPALSVTCDQTTPTPLS